jgi:hypothetical protein
LNDAAMVLMTVTIERDAPTLEDAALALGVAIGDIDAAFGLVPVDPGQGVYAVKVRADRIRQNPGEPYSGPFSDPEIGPAKPPHS